MSAAMAGRLAGLRDMEAGVVATDDDPTASDVVRCRGWLALDRQAGQLLDLAEASSKGRAARGLSEEAAAHKASLRSVQDRARSRATAFDDDVRNRAGQRLGLRLALVGKGGAGKTVTAATLARLLARRGRKVLAVDLDTNPGLAFSLGLPHDTTGLPAEAVEEHQGAAYGWQLASGLSPEVAVRRYTTPAPDGVRYLGVGKIDAPEKQAARQTMIAVLQILRGFADPEWDVIADLEAGPTTPFEGYHTFAERVLVVVGPEWRSALTARRLLPVIGAISTTVVANRWRGADDHAGLVPAVRIPFDPAVVEAERLGRAPLDHCPGSPAMSVIEDLADQLTTSPLTTSPLTMSPELTTTQQEVSP
jgi:CO dehydrogenase maturation factor